jgi:hypothetical protein
LRPGRIAPSLPNRRADEAIEAMRAAMGRREREELAIDQVGRELAPVERASVPGEAAAEVIERAQRQQLALDLDGGPTMLEPVPDVLRAVRGLEPLWAVAHRIGVAAQGREAIERARPTLADVPREALLERVKRLDALLAIRLRTATWRRATRPWRLPPARRVERGLQGRSQGP